MLRTRTILFATAGLLALFLGLVVYVSVVTTPYIHTSEHVPSAEVAMVLGASVTSKGVLSPVLKQRADKAAELYEGGKVTKILVTGDDGTKEHNEVYPVGKYLLALGIPQEDIFLDHAGFDTYSSMYRAREVFGVTSVLIVSQYFHLPRAVFIARSLGLDAEGVDASNDEPYLRNSLRELPAFGKAFIDLSVGRIPKYLGTPYPISGEGDATWADDPPLRYFKTTIK